MYQLQKEASVAQQKMRAQAPTTVQPGKAPRENYESEGILGKIPESVESVAELML